MLHGARYWRVQHEEIRHQRVFAENWDHDQAAIAARIAPILAQGDDFLAKHNVWLEEMYRKHPTLAPSPEERIARRMREQADTIEIAGYNRRASEMMQQRAMMLQRCEGIIATKLH